MNESLVVEALKSNAALSSTFNKGLAIARRGDGVTTDRVTTGSLGSTLSLAGRVEGSYGASYHTEIQLDADTGEVLDYYCTCPAMANYSGICKHVIALALTHLAREGMGPAIASGGAPADQGPALSWNRPPLAGAVGPRGAARSKGKPQQLPSSPQIADLLDVLGARRLQELETAYDTAHEDAVREEPVELLVGIATARDAYYSWDDVWCVKLRVRRGKTTYVVKNIGDLLAAYRDGLTVRYGKNLEFAHVPRAFTERSQRIIAVVDRVAASQQALFLSRWRYQEAGRGTDIKELPISSADLIDILDILQGASFAFEPNDGKYGTRGKSRPIDVVTGDPALAARLTGAPDGGCDLAVSGASHVFSDGKRTYIVDQTRAWRCSDGTARHAELLDLLIKNRTLHISARDLPEFCRDALPALRRAFEVEAPSALDELTPPEAAFTFRVGLADGRVSCQASVAYGTWETELYGQAYITEQATRFVPDTASIGPVRDRIAEYRAMSVVERIFPGGALEVGELPGFDEYDDELLYDLLTSGLQELDALGDVLLSERLRAVRVRPNPRLSVRATVSHGLLDVAVDTSGLTADDLAAYLASLKRRERFVRLSNGDIMRLESDAADVIDLADGLGVDAEDLADGIDGLPANRVLFVDTLVKRAGGMRLSRNDAFRAIVREFDSYADADAEVPADLHATLRPYQVDGFRWLSMLDRFGFGGILADDMGLGKTLQVIACLLAAKEREAQLPDETPRTGAEQHADEAAEHLASLVVCPASLVYNWIDEIQRFAPTLDAVAVIGSKAARKRIIAAAAERVVLITSYDLMKRDVDAYEGQRFNLVILDEAQYIKNARTNVARAAKRLPARNRFALTGTPIENRTSELWSIFDFLMPGILGTGEQFAKRYQGPIEGGDERATERLRCLIAPFVLRRLKEDVLADLPEKTENVVRARMEGEQAKLYHANQDRIALQVTHQLPDQFKKEKLKILAELTKLRQICCDPSLAFADYHGGNAKLDTCMELVASAIEAGHRILLFSQFTSMLDILAERLRAEGITYFTLTGETTKDARRRLVKRFQNGDAQVFLISLRAGGVGLNLTAADVVIHYDPWWNLAAQNQATDRAHRIGQERAVTVYKLICADTIEERILAMQESKRELAEGLLSGEGVRSTALNRDDVLSLLESAGA